MILSGLRIVNVRPVRRSPPFAALDPTATAGVPWNAMEDASNQFGTWLAQDRQLRASADVAIREVLKVKEHERVLIVTNPTEEVYSISLALHDAAADVGASVTLAVQPVKGQLDFAEEAVVGMIKSEPDVLISMSAVKLGKDRKAIIEPYTVGGHRYDNTFHYLLHGVKKTRAFWSPGVTRDIFVRTVPINYQKLHADCTKVSQILDAAVEVLITNKNGTNCAIGLRNRLSKHDDGDFARPGTGGNLPAGETYISPELGTARGTIVFDGSISLHDGDAVIREAIRAEIEGGFVVAVAGGAEARRLEETIRLGEQNAVRFEADGKLPAGLGKLYQRNARNLGELGIGLNPKAEVIGNMLVDEKAARTCHIAIGSNYDEDAPALIHLDGLVSEPTITAFFADGQKKTFLTEGELTVS